MDIHRASLISIVVILLFPEAGECAAYPRIPAHGYVAEKAVSTTVDSELAKYYLEDYGTREANPGWDARIAGIEQRFKSRPLDSSELKEISDETSPDFSTLFFIRQTLSDPVNKRFQTSYSEEAKRERRSRTPVNGSAGTVRRELQKYKLIFIPGFHYVSDKTSGADFFYERQFLGRLGLDVQLVATEEDGAIEDNAAIIARTIRTESGDQRKLILVSTSKGGPETALALGKILRPAETSSVKAWVSVGGLMRGTILANPLRYWPESSVARMILPFEGMKFRGLAGLTTTASRKRIDAVRLPGSILIIQYIAAPLSGDIKADVESRYQRLRKYGPNDGMTLLADELLPNGITIFEPGLDHFYQGPDIYLKSLAIINIIGDALAR